MRGNTRVGYGALRTIALTVPSPSNRFHSVGFGLERTISSHCSSRASARISSAASPARTLTLTSVPAPKKTFRSRSSARLFSWHTSS
ncbi:MAG TPA: hypothetical protein VH619_18145 [Verrucomicrobiae bacterium]|nr:hypothetical protein [Verrucomicrobiae bacterium]